MKANSEQWKRILVVIDDPFARDQLALAKAARIALATGAKLVLFNSFMLPQPITDVPMGSQRQIIAAAVRQRRERMQAMVAYSPELHAECIVEWDYPAHEAIVRQVLKSKPDLVVTASHRRGRLARMVLSNTDWEVMRLCPCPVWFVRSAQLQERPRALVAVDPFHAHDKPPRLDNRLMRTADLLRRNFGASIMLIHAHQEDRNFLALAPAVLARAEQAVHDLGAKYDLIPEYCEVREGPAEEVIPSAARRDDADVLIMGVVSRSLPERPFIGGTAERVIDRVGCDLLAVKPAGFKSPVQLKDRAPGEGERKKRRPVATDGKRRPPVTHAH